MRSAAAALPLEETGGPTLTLDEFRRLGMLIREETGISLGDHKQTLMRARLGRRLREHGLTSYHDYYELLTKRDPHGAELREMVNAITTNLTSFFREPHHFEHLEREVLAPLKRSANKRLRIWSAGCSTGEEPYTVAMTVLDAFGPATGDTRILASDIDTEVLTHAERGVYGADRVASLPTERLHRHFRRGVGKADGLVQVNAAARDLITFRRINFRDETWPIQTRFDVIFCRNVLIYFDRPLQEQIVGRFVDLLLPNGHLFLGHSESGLANRRDLVCRGRTIYQKRGEGA